MFFYCIMDFKKAHKKRDCVCKDLNAIDNIFTFTCFALTCCALTLIQLSPQLVCASLICHAMLTLPLFPP